MIHDEDTIHETMHKHYRKAMTGISGPLVEAMTDMDCNERLQFLTKFFRKMCDDVEYRAALELISRTN